MASTYSPNLRLELIGTGEQQGTWGATTNTNLGTLLEEAIGGYVSVTVSNVADTTLTTNNGSADQSRNMVINLTGTISAARTVICPAIEKLYVVKNATTGGFAVTFKVSGQTGVSIPNGETYFLYVDGTDVRQITGGMASQNSNNVSITGGSISGATISGGSVSSTSLSNVSVVANASSLSVRDADGSHIMSIAVGSNLTANRVLTITTGDAARTLDISSGSVTISAAGASLIDDASASDQRTTLGLGTVATQNANNVSITGGSISGIADLALADGGTGASLSDPNANAILGWNDTAGTMRFFTAGTGITINATSNTISSTVSTSGALLRAPQVLTSGTSYTAPAGCASIYVEAVGGGGGGGGADADTSTSLGSGGGGAGAYVAKYFSVTAGSSYAYAIGAGGTGGTAGGGNGANGGNTTFTVGAVVITAGGGSGGEGADVTSGGSGGSGGVASNGDINISGNPGGSGSKTGDVNDRNSGGNGGVSYFGGAGKGGYSSANGGAGTFGGGGGGGAQRNTTSGVTGGAGGAGIIRIWEYS